MAKLDQIEALAASHESELKEALANAYSELLAGFPLNIVSSSLDDIDPDHIRDQLEQILDLNDNGVPDSFEGQVEKIADKLDSFILAIAALAAAQAGHTINDRDSKLTGARQAARAFANHLVAEAALQISAAIETAIMGRGSTDARAEQLRRSIGLSAKQAATLEAMRLALRQHIVTPRRFISATTNADGVQIPARYTRTTNIRPIIAGLRGWVSAGQLRLVMKALANANLRQVDATRLLDSHAAALRSFRLNAIAGETVHELAEIAKLAGWQTAQHYGALPADQRRFWQTADDERVRHTHRQVSAMNPDGVQLAEPFETPFGPRMNAPLEWGCRCKVTLGPTG